MWYNDGMGYSVLYFILLLLGALSFVGATLGRQLGGGNGGVNGGAVRARAYGLLPLGLLLWILVPLIQTGRVVFH